MKKLAQKLASLGYYVTDKNEIAQMTFENKNMIGCKLQDIINNSHSRRVKRRKGNDKTRRSTISRM